VSTPALDLAPAVPAPASAPADGPPAVTRPRRAAVTWVTRVASVVISLGALAILLRRVDLPAALRTAATEPWPSLASALALNAVATWLRATRSQWVLNGLGQRIGRVRNAAIQLAGQVLSWVSPAAAGDFVRPYLWRSHDGVALTPGVVTVLYERIVSFGQLSVIGAACMAPFVLGGPVLAAVAAAAAVLLALPWLVARTVQPPAKDSGQGLRAASWRGRVSGAATEVWHLAGQGRLSLRFAVLTIAIVAVSALQIELLAAGVGISLSLWIAAAAFAISQVIGSASSLPFGLGPADAVLVALLVHAGTGPAGALAITLLTRLTVTLPLGLAGAASYLWLSRRAPDRSPST
jgi:uncharacterized membrane protein YbhN (UPF0104 family)